MTNLEMYQKDLANIYLEETKTFEFKGIKAMMIRKSSGILLGYVELSEHLASLMSLEKAEDMFECHGGISFIGEKEDGYYIGFHTNNARDWSVEMDGLLPNLTYYGYDYVLNELQGLAYQVRVAESMALNNA